MIVLESREYSIIKTASKKSKCYKPICETIMYLQLFVCQLFNDCVNYKWIFMLSEFELLLILIDVRTVQLCHFRFVEFNINLICIHIYEF